MQSIYEQRPWLSSYPEGVATDLETTSATAIDRFQPIRPFPGPTFPRSVILIIRFPMGKSTGCQSHWQPHSALSDFRPGIESLWTSRNVPQFLVATYAAWKLGIIVVPVNPMSKRAGAFVLLR